MLVTIIGKNFFRFFMFNIDVAFADRNTDYMSFGLSGSDSTFSMIGSDIVVADYRESSQPRAIDYYISDYAQVCLINLHSIL